jgi:hypothetical protein
MWTEAIAASDANKSNPVSLHFAWIRAAVFRTSP